MMRHWFLTSAFLFVTAIGFVIFMFFVAFFSVARTNLKDLIYRFYPDQVAEFAIKQLKQKQLKRRLKRNLLSQTGGDTISHATTDDPFTSRNILTSEYFEEETIDSGSKLKRKVRSGDQRSLQEQTHENKSVIENAIIFVASALFD
jgi:hypothetical protein